MFIVFASLLVFIALLFVLPPLIGKTRPDVSDLQQANLEASRQRLDDLALDAEQGLVAKAQMSTLREETQTTLMLEMQHAQSRPVTEKSPRFYFASTALIALSVPMIAFLVYLSVGNPAALTAAVLDPAEQAAGQTLDELLEKLELRLAQQPDDQQGWLILAQTNMIMARYPQAVAAMEQLYRLSGDTPDVLARYADALTMANDGQFNDKAMALVEKALEINPDHVHALWLSGMQAYQNENFAAAVGFFNRARAGITDAENLAQLNGLTRSAIERGNLDQPMPTPAPQAALPAIEVSVALDPALKSRVKPDDVLFVFARAASGPPMPLAVSRLTAANLPVTVSLDDSMAMMPELKLSEFDQIVISARISKSGQPVAQPGDLQGTSGILGRVSTTRVDVLIDQLVE